MISAKKYDGLNYLSGLTPYKLWNMLKLRVSYLLSVWLKKPVIFGLPEATAIEPTTSCNLRCPECPSGLRSFTRDTGMLDYDLFRQIIDAQKKHLTYLTFYFQGEPYLNPRFLDCVKYAAERNIYTSTSTNAHFLTPENAEKTVKSGLDRLIISIDGTTQETYRNYRIGGRLDKVLEGTKNVVASRKRLGSKTPYLIFQFLVVRPNEHQVKDAQKLAREIGVDEIKFKTAQIYDYHNGSKLIPTIDYYSRYRKEADGTYRLKNEQKNHCWRTWHSNVITWDGNVLPCCFDKDAEHVAGNVSSTAIKTILKSGETRAFRKQLLTDRSRINICRNCSEGTAIFK